MKKIILILLAALLVVPTGIYLKEPVSISEMDVTITIEDMDVPLGALVVPESDSVLDSAWLGGARLRVIGDEASLGPGGGDFVGLTRSEIEAQVGLPLKRFQNTTIEALNTANRSYYAYGDGILLVYYDTKYRNQALFTLEFSADIARATRFMLQPALSSEDFNTLEADTLTLLNSIRLVYNRTSLDYSSPVAAVARAHSDDMVLGGYFSHTNRLGDGAKARLQAANISFSSYGEALTAGTFTPVEAITAWLNSDGHRPILLGDYKAAGVGIAMGSSYGIYYTMKFIK